MAAGRSIGLLALLFGLVLPGLAGAQVQTFYPVLPPGSDEATQLCARRFSQPLVRSGGFRRSPDSSELVQTSDCLNAVATPESRRSCELSLAQIEVDYLVRFYHQSIGNDVIWSAEVVSPQQGASVIWADDLRQPAAGTDAAAEAAYEACDTLAAAFGCAQGATDLCPALGALADQNPNLVLLQPADLLVTGGLVGGLGATSPEPTNPDIAPRTPRWSAGLTTPLTGSIAFDEDYVDNRYGDRSGGLEGFQLRLGYRSDPVFGGGVDLVAAHHTGYGFDPPSAYDCDGNCRTLRSFELDRLGLELVGMLGWFELSMGGHVTRLALNGGSVGTGGSMQYGLAFLPLQLRYLRAGLRGDLLGEFVSGNQMFNMQLAWQLDLLL